MKRRSFRMRIDVRGVTELLNRHLYSSPEVFVREFLKNAVDAIAKRSVRDGFAPQRIDVRLTKARGRKPAAITFTDSGTGLTPEEVRSVFSTVCGVSMKYNTRRPNYIDKFGIGVLSGFLASNSVEFATRSASGETGSICTAQINGLCRIVSAEVKTIGSSVTLRCKEGFEEYFEEDRLGGILKLYGSILPYPIYFSADGAEAVLINGVAPPWLTLGLSTSEEIIAFGEDNFDERFMGYIPLKSETGGVEGVAYLLSRRVAPGERGAHHIYYRNIFLTDKGDCLLPSWAFFLKAALNVHNLTPDLSREGFVEDDMLNRTRVELGKCIKIFFKKIAIDNKYLMDRFFSEHLVGLKLIALEDREILQMFMDYFPFETTLGTFPFSEIREVAGTIRYVNKVDEFRQLSPVFNAGGVILVNAGYAYDAELMAMIALCNPDIPIERLDINDVMPAMQELLEDEYERYRNLKESASKYLSRLECAVDIRKFLPEGLPALFLASEEASFVSAIRKSKGSSRAALADLFTLFDSDDEKSTAALCLNTRNKVIKRMAERNYDDSAGFDLLYIFGTLMARRQLSDKEISVFNESLLSLIGNGEAPPSHTQV